MKRRRYLPTHKLRKWMIDEVLDALSDGRVTLEGAAKRIKVPPATLRTWINRGRSGRGTSLEIELASRVDDLLYELESFWARQLETDKEWNRWLKLLERRFPQSWGSLTLRYALELSEDDGLEIVEQ